MKKRELKDLQIKTIQELKGMVGTKKADIGKLRLEFLSKQQKNVRVVKNARRDLSQIATVLHQKELLEK